MLISNNRKLKEIQTDFRRLFPNLKIEFYSDHHDVGEGSSFGSRLDPEATIGQVRKEGSEGDLRIHSKMKVSTFEGRIYQRFGLNVQVFRKSGNLWMQTTSTDHWTLAQQNRKGGSSILHYEEKYNN